MAIVSNGGNPAVRRERGARRPRAHQGHSSGTTHQPKAAIRRWSFLGWRSAQI